MRFEVVFFDLDGTLVDSLPDIAAALNHALGNAGLQPLSLDAVRALVGDGVVALAARALAAQPPQSRPLPTPDELADMVRRHYRAHPCRKTRVYPHIEEVLEELRRRGQRLFVLTNKPGDIARALLAALDLERRFEGVIGDGDGFPRKPDPTAPLAVLARLGVAPERAVVVGDGVPDMRVARAAACAAVAVGWGYGDRALLSAEGPTALIDDPRELLALR